MAINFEKEFSRLHPEQTFILRYMHEALDKDEVTFDDMTALNLTAFTRHLMDIVSPNTANYYCSIVKSFLNLMSEEVDIPTKRFAKILTIKRVPQQNVALSEEEVCKIDEYYNSLSGEGRDIVEKEVLNLFLLECYCGARGCDTEAMTEDNISDGSLSYVSKKTHILATMPIHYRLRELLERKPTKKYLRATKNRIVKRVCRKVGIDYPVTIFYHGEMVTKPKYEFCAFHTARRSFASMLSAKGVPIAEIAQYMSHANTTMTERYIKVDTNKASAAAMTFFGGQQSAIS